MLIVSCNLIDVIIYKKVSKNKILYNTYYYIASSFKIFIKTSLKFKKVTKKTRIFVLMQSKHCLSLNIIK